MRERERVLEESEGERGKEEKIGEGLKIEKENDGERGRLKGNIKQIERIRQKRRCRE